MTKALPTVKSNYYQSHLNFTSMWHSISAGSFVCSTRASTKRVLLNYNWGNVHGEIPFPGN